MKKISIILTISLLIVQYTFAHPWKPDHYVVIDTDCGFDDFRAVQLMLASPNIRVLAIITSNGVLSAEDGFSKIKSLLKEKYSEGLLLGFNSNAQQKTMGCAPAIKFSWGELINSQEEPANYEDILNQVFNNSKEQITFINLGGINTFETYFGKYPENRQRLKDVLWTVDDKNLETSFNFLLDTVSFQSVKADDITFISGSTFGSYTDELMNELKKMNNSLSVELSRSLTFSESIYTKKVYDESVVFYLLEKEIFSVDTIEDHITYRLADGCRLSNQYMNILDDLTRVQSQVFLDFYADSTNYNGDIKPIVSTTIEKFGKEEWEACVLTSELHRHLGVYSLVGAKMGTRAREYFGAGIDELKVYSYAGLEPPFSCLNDGLQVSTGATLGHGLISVDKNSALPRADFHYLGQKITISLKEEYRREIASKIKELSFVYGLDSNIYWDLVRELAIKYWEKWDRHEIFEIQAE